MKTAINFFAGNLWLTISIGLILLPFVTLLVRKSGHFFKLLGFYRRPGDRPPWAPNDLMPEQISLYLGQIAADHISTRRRCNRSIDRLHWQIYMDLQSLRRSLSHTPAQIISLVPASQWFFDNYNFFYKELNKLQLFGNLRKFRSMPGLKFNGESDYPRIYRVARELVGLGNYHLDVRAVMTMIDAYQKTQPLLARELWALPDALVLCLLEKAVDESRRVRQVIRIKHLADHLADRLAAMPEPDAELFADAVRKERCSDCLDNMAFVSHLYFRMKAMAVSEADIIGWIAHALCVGQDECAPKFYNLIEDESGYESDAEATIRSLVTSLKVISDINWDEVLQSISTLDRILAGDPAGCYLRMNSQTRGLYRSTVEKLARGYHTDESDVAKTIAQWAQSPPWPDLPEPAHVGTYLTGRGLYRTKKVLSGREWKKSSKDICRRLQAALYWSSIILLTAGMVAGGIITATGSSNGFQQPSTAVLILTGILLAFLGISIAMSIVQDISARLVRPRSQLALDYDEGIPDQDRTFVVMPVIINSREQILEYIARLEKHYLANQQENLYFAILADFQDAATETLPEDQDQITAATEAIHQLNIRHPGKLTRFLLLYRPRQWNETDQCWMGWERKRGKLEELNALLTGECADAFVIAAGDPDILRSFRFVITIDADTELVRDSAAMLVGIMAHPLNRPHVDMNTMQVTDGYAIVQPEIRSKMPGPSASLFARVYASQAGIDPYGTVVSDVYQDVFNEGTFVGKGIYEIKTMHLLLHGNIPENSVLSHDLLEGSLARCAFASGVKFMDAHPSGIISYIRREHRWIRGDWQLLPWLFRPSPLNWLSRWKMIDNMRRSLLQPAALLLILTCALALPGTPLLWLPFLGFDVVYSLLKMILRIIIQKNRNPSMRLAINAMRNHILAGFLKLLMEIILIPVRGILAMDGIIRTLYRLLVSHRNLLEWQTAESIDRSVQKTLHYHLRVLWPAMLPAIPLFLAAFIRHNFPWNAVFSVLALLWLLSPLLAWIVSLKKHLRLPSRTRRDQISRLRVLSRRTWNYFEDFATEKTHWLCPDNYQKSPGPKVSDKSSPTNIGLQLLSTLAAHDMGFIGLAALVENCEKVLRTVEQLPKWQGHLYNWYQIYTLRVLEPQYISTVDSGNFVAHLITLRHGLLDLKNKPVLSEKNIQGLMDTLRAAGLDDLQADFGKSPDPSWRENLNSLKGKIDSLPVDVNWKKRIDRLCAQLIEDSFRSDNDNGQKSLGQLAGEGVAGAMDLVSRIDNLSGSISRLVQKTDFRPLYDRKHMLFMIGYDVSTQSPDSGRYDLLASEARLASYVAIAKGDVPQKHWFALGRPFTLIRGTPTLLSWSGSMFEYLMPTLVLKTPSGSIFGQSSRAAVTRQIIQGRRMKIPWGVSESQYYAFDVQSNYQYMSFGVMNLRLQSTLKPAQVVAPYATMLALMIRPAAALKNIDRLHRLGAAGDYGFFEALDFSRPDSTRLRNFSLVQSVMVHHLGMSLIAADNFLNQFSMHERFHQEPMIQAAESLLEETVAVGLVSVNRRWYTINVNASETDEDTAEHRTVLSAGTPEPITHVLANRSWMTMLTSDGEGFSSCEGSQVNRWQPDSSGRGYGSFIYLRNLDSGHFWSSTWRPTCVQPDSYQVVFSSDKAEFNRRDGMINTKTEVTVSPQHNLELRRVTLSNNNDKPVTIELTSYLEPVADDYRADTAHPAFSKLFIETSYHEDLQMLVSRRRPRSQHDPGRMVMHRITAEARLEQKVQFEIDRRAFIGRNSSLNDPQLLHASMPLSGRTGFTPDPIQSLRAVVRIPAGNSASVVFLTGFARSDEEIMQMNDEYDRLHVADDIFKNALTASRLKMKYLSVNFRQFNAIQNLTSAIFYPSALFRGPAEALLRNRLGQSSLWRFGISGDHPIILLRVRDLKSAPLIRDVLTAFEVLRSHHVMVDLVVFNDEKSGYAMELNRLIQGMTSRLRVFSDQPASAGIFIVNRFQISPEEEDLLLCVARIMITPESGIYFRHLRSPKEDDVPYRPAISARQEVIMLPPGDKEQTVGEESAYAEEHPLELYNGLGGFSRDGREYVIRIRSGMKTPSPWINVIANEKFGFLVSETGAGYTWAGNSRENKLTVWSNDPVLDPVSEAVYLRDEISGAVTSPCMIGGGYGGYYQVRHGFGYTVFEHDELGLKMQMTVFTSPDKPARFWHLSIENAEQEARSLTLTLYVDWLLGVSRDQASPYVLTGFDRKKGCLYAQNPYHELFNRQQAFIFSSEKVTSWTGNRREFIGHGESARYPKGLTLKEFSGEVGAGLDPCGVIQIAVHLKGNESKQMVFGMGHVHSAEAMDSFAWHLRQPEAALKELEAVHSFWAERLGDVQLHSPDKSLDFLLNGWLRYQVLSCRIMARTAFYQCGGAFGFRDQLQDVLAFLESDPDLVRRQILLCSSRQFVEGDVQHWWHPPKGTGVRTKISDDLLWLPYVTAEYVESTGDTAILSERTPWLLGDILTEDQHEVMSTPLATETADTLYRHCLKAIEHAASFGRHGLPLIGSGDWNDGMNRVGIEGHGESVWLGWFLYSVLHRFIPICKKFGEARHARQLATMAANLTGNLESAAWDGEWYIRAFFDNGNPLGSRQNQECRIDSISQSWAVLSGAADPHRAAIALESARQQLIRDPDNAVALLTPPFDKGPDNPGYIRGYYPGVRENGGQYTHAAIWLAMASAKLKHTDEAWRILNLINPAKATSDLGKAYRYEKEPYVVAADICLANPLRGHAGWSWYTGSASWLYQAILHSYIGLVRQKNKLVIDPCIAAGWQTWQVDYRYGKTVYQLSFSKKTAQGICVSAIILDGQEISGNSIELVDDGKAHHAEIKLTDAGLPPS